MPYLKVSEDEEDQKPKDDKKKDFSEGMKSMQGFADVTRPLSDFAEAMRRRMLGKNQGDK